MDLWPAGGPEEDKSGEADAARAREGNQGAAALSLSVSLSLARSLSSCVFQMLSMKSSIVCQDRLRTDIKQQLKTGVVFPTG